MNTKRKLKVSVTLAPDLVARIDRRAAREQGTRSQVIERWLRRAARDQARQELDSEIAAYYEALTSEQQAEDAALAVFSGKAARELDLDGPPPPRRRRRG
ncbi:MAG: ribbon-helix-helix protein, CopG family [Myxococcales bacterium]|nr:ribbon-helix-helix protein, CopG family [Myxococcales bacterium]